MAADRLGTPPAERRRVSAAEQRPGPPVSRLGRRGLGVRRFPSQRRRGRARDTATHRGCKRSGSGPPDTGKTYPCHSPPPPPQLGRPLAPLLPPPLPAPPRRPHRGAAARRPPAQAGKDGGSGPRRSPGPGPGPGAASPAPRRLPGPPLAGAGHGGKEAARRGGAGPVTQPAAAALRPPAQVPPAPRPGQSREAVKVDK